MKKAIIKILLSVTMIICLSACTNKPADLPNINPYPQTEKNTLTESVNKPDTPNTQTPPPALIDHETDTPPTPTMTRSRITNEWVSKETAETRPIAIIVPNSKTASQYGLSQAAILYECNVEGSMTRLMGIWDDWSDLDKIGNIRSIRDYFVYWALEWDAILIHYGGPFYADEILNKTGTQNIDCLRYLGASFRQDAKNTTDNAFTGTQVIRDAIDAHKYSLNYRIDIAAENHFLFAAPGRPNTLRQYANSVNAKTIDMSPTYPLTNCYFKYNIESGLYDRFQHLSGESDGPHLDMMNGEQLTFKNIIIQNTYYEQRDQQGYLAFQCHDNTRTGWFFTGGRGIRITWEKARDNEPTRYYDEKGDEIEINTGKTMILIIQDGDSFLINGKRNP